MGSTIILTFMQTRCRCCCHGSCWIDLKSIEGGGGGGEGEEEEEEDEGWWRRIFVVVVFFLCVGHM